MNTREAFRQLGPLAADQWGLITTAQASDLGVDRLALSRLHGAGLLERISQGVYRTLGAPEHEHEPILAAWLALADPSSPDDLVVAGAAAARLHGIGQLGLPTIDLVSARRRSSRRDGVRCRRLHIDPGHIVTAHGAPTMSAARTIVDVLELGQDPSNVADLAMDALRAGITDVDDIHRTLESRRHQTGTATSPLFALALQRRITHEPRIAA